MNRNVFLVLLGLFMPILALAKTPISNAGYIINSPGAYYLTTNLSQNTTIPAISINATT
jgi:hypothetical protein